MAADPTKALNRHRDLLYERACEKLQSEQPCNQEELEEVERRKKDQDDVWNVNRLYDKTGFDRRTIKRWLMAAGKPVENPTLRDFCDAIRFDAEAKAAGTGPDASRDRKLALECELLEIELARSRNEVIEADVVFRVWENIIVPIRRTLETSELSNDRKDSIFRELISIPIESYIGERSVDSGAGGTNAEPVSAAGKTDAERVGD